MLEEEEEKKRCLLLFGICGVEGSVWNVLGEGSSIGVGRMVVDDLNMVSIVLFCRLLNIVVLVNGINFLCIMF